MPAPSIGRIVIFRDGDGDDWPAIIHKTFKGSTTVNLTPFTEYSGGAGPDREIKHTESKPEGDPSVPEFTWRWPIIP